jgi:hypothetical protein
MHKPLRITTAKILLALDKIDSCKEIVSIDITDGFTLVFNSTLILVKTNVFRPTVDVSTFIYFFLNF